MGRGSPKELSRILVVATGGAGGDLQPLVAASLAMQRLGHEIVFLGDHAVRTSLVGLPMRAEVLPPDLDLGPRLIAAVREAMTASHGDVEAGGPIVQERLAEWAREAAAPAAAAIARLRPAAVLASLFGVEVLKVASPACPWVVVNSTFYIGPGSPRPLEQDVAPRAAPLLARYAGLLDAPDLVLHATDRIFDLSFDGLPPRHHYVGPLGVWEPPSEPPAWVTEPGPAWVLVSISSQSQDDIPLAQAALAALADRPVRVVATVGPGHDPQELATVPSNAHVERTISHAALLRRGAILVSHAGHGSVMKAMWYGCPMVLVPWGRDQPGVAARAARLGLAEVVPRESSSSETLRLAVDRVLESEEMRAAARDHASRLQASDPEEEAASLIGPLLT